MNPRHLPVPAACFSALILFAGCAGLQVSGYLQQGRNALRAGKPATAVSYLRSAADLDPNYHAPDPFHGSVLTYLGRAYYETGNLAEARTVLEKALANAKEDYMAGFYLGLLRLRGGDQDSRAPRGRDWTKKDLRHTGEPIDQPLPGNLLGSRKKNSLANPNCIERQNNANRVPRRS